MVTTGTGRTGGDRRVRSAAATLALSLVLVEFLAGMQGYLSLLAVTALMLHRLAAASRRVDAPAR